MGYLNVTQATLILWVLRAFALQLTFQEIQFVPSTFMLLSLLGFQITFIQWQIKVSVKPKPGSNQHLRMNKINSNSRNFCPRHIDAGQHRLGFDQFHQVVMVLRRFNQTLRRLRDGSRHLTDLSLDAWMETMMMGHDKIQTFQQHNIQHCLIRC